MRQGYRGWTRWGTTLVGAAFAASACSGPATPVARTTSRPSPSRSSVPTPSAAPRVDPASVHADELGAIPVLMYHQLVAKPKGDYDQTPEQFRAELTALYAHGYRTITAAELVAGQIGVPAGKKPMVLTFDDSTVSQFAELPDGSVDPRSGVGILEAVAKAAGEARPVASFYVNGSPFGGKDAALTDLHALGMEVAEHTLTHANLRQLSDGGVQQELAQGQLVITRAVPGVAVTTMALPFGVLPRNRVLAAKGSSAGTSYDFAGVLAVGSNPAPSPYASTFDPMYVPRIRSGRRTGDQALTSTYWLPKLFNGEVRSYVSDGDPAHISFPKAHASRLAPRYAAQARPY